MRGPLRPLWVPLDLYTLEDVEHEVIGLAQWSRETGRRVVVGKMWRRKRLLFGEE